MPTPQVPSDCIGYITGSRRATLGRMEEELLDQTSDFWGNLWQLILGKHSADDMAVVVVVLLMAREETGFGTCSGCNIFGTLGGFNSDTVPTEYSLSKMIHVV